MKKLLLITAVGIAGLMSAGNAKPMKECKSKKSGGAYYNVAVATTCGAPYSQRLWFDAVPTAQDLQNIATAMNIALCGEEGGSGTAVKAKDESVG